MVYVTYEYYKSIYGEDSMPETKRKANNEKNNSI